MLGDFFYWLWGSLLQIILDFFPVLEGGASALFSGVSGTFTDILGTLSWYIDAAPWAAGIGLVAILFSVFIQWKLLLFLYDLLPIAR